MTCWRETIHETDGLPYRFTQYLFTAQPGAPVQLDLPGVSRRGVILSGSIVSLLACSNQIVKAVAPGV